MKVKVFVLDGLNIHKHMIEDGIFLNAWPLKEAPKMREASLSLNWSSDGEGIRVNLGSLTLEEEKHIELQKLSFQKSKPEKRVRLYERLVEENLLLKRKVNESKNPRKGAVSYFWAEELEDELLSLKSEIRVVNLEKDSMIETLKSQLEKEVKSKNKLL